MKKYIFATGLTMCAAFNASALPVEQEGGTIVFNGVVVTSACILSAASEDQNVVLMDAPTTSFGGVTDALAGKTQPFDIVLSGCDSQIATTVALAFTGNGDANGVLQSDGTATGVAFKVTSATDEPVPFDGTAMLGIPIVDGTTTLPFKADYISTDTAPTAGSVTASATFTISYQ